MIIKLAKRVLVWHSVLRYLTTPPIYWSNECRALIIEWRKLLTSALNVWYPLKLRLLWFVQGFYYNLCEHVVYNNWWSLARGQLKCDGTRAETRFRLSAKRTSPIKSAGRRQFSRLLAADVCASAVVMLDTPCSEVVWRVLAAHSTRQFPIHFPSRASPCAIIFQMECTTWFEMYNNSSDYSRT